MKLRLDKYLADMGIGTRTEVKKAITKGQVRVNEETVKRPEIKIDTEKDHVFYQGQMVAYAEYEYYMLNKPAGVVSATEDKNDSTVLDLIDEKQRKDLFPVGRLDKDTEGLLLITNDGELAHQLLSPKKHVDKVYFARIDGKVTEEDVRRFAEGRNRGRETDTSGSSGNSEKRRDFRNPTDDQRGEVSSGETNVPCSRKRGYLSETPADGKPCT